MDIWNIPGIDRTRDIAAIRTAYAGRAKRYHPEEHPEEFKELQKAYRAALQYARSGKETACAGEETDGHQFDFSVVDSYGEKELLLRQFRLLIYNPCLINNPLAWHIFFDRPMAERLLGDQTFAEEFVRTICITETGRLK